jgi:hypothetical protein
VENARRVQNGRGKRAEKAKTGEERQNVRSAVSAGQRRAKNGGRGQKRAKKRQNGRKAARRAENGKTVEEKHVRAHEKRVRARTAGVGGSRGWSG